MTAHHHRPPTPEVDPDITAELPTLELAAQAEDPLSTTDTMSTLVLPPGAPGISESLREIEERLNGAGEQVRQREAELAQVREAMQALQDTLATREGELASARAELAGCRQQILDLQQAGQRQQAQVEQQAREIGQLRRGVAGHVEALQHAQGLRAVLEGLLGERDGRVADARAQHAAELAAVQEQALQHGQELAQLRAQSELAREGARMYEAQQARIRELEDELRDATLLLGNLQQDIVRLGSAGEGVRPALHMVDGTPLPDRFLVRDEAGMEVGYPLGMRTTIGRTPDNDIQVDQTFISRHHAVIHCTSRQCTIEDLGSTNGVAVNGRRTSRRVLHDGDNVSFGKTVFRFQQSP